MLRRFDVFAVYNYVKNLNKGMPEDRAKGDALWLAKHVAGGRRIKVGGGALQPAQRAAKHCACKGIAIVLESPWKMLSGIEQTNEMYDREIVKRMGEQFYSEILLPRMKELSSEKYQDIRDTVREELEPKWEESYVKVRSAGAFGSESGTSFRLSV